MRDEVHLPVFFFEPNQGLSVGKQAVLEKKLVLFQCTPRHATVAMFQLFQKEIINLKHRQKPWWFDLVPETTKSESVPCAVA